MAVNGSADFLSNCTSQSESNCSGDPLFECMDSFLRIILNGFSTLVNVALVLPMNIWILWLARKTTGVKSPDFVIFNQSIAEVIANTSIIVFLLGSIFNKKVVILISSYLCCTLIVGRPLFQTIFCVEQYLAVVHPLVYPKYMTTLKLKLPFVGLVWLLILICGWFIMESYPSIPKFYIVQLIIMLAVCSSCSVMILWVLKRPKPGDGKKEKEGGYHLKRKAFVAVTVILTTLVFGNGTVACVIILRDYLPYDIYCLALSVSWCTLVPSALVQPYLYLSKLGKLPCIKSH